MRYYEIIENRLMELRRNPEVNIKTPTLEALKKYASDPDVYVSFTAAMPSRDSKTKYSKLGINPSSTYNTPIGIYSYPIDYVIQKNLKVPFAGDRPFIQVFRNAGKVLELDAYSKADLENDIEKVMKICQVSADDIQSYKNNAIKQTPGGMFWNITRMASQKMKDSSLTRAVSELSEILYDNSDLLKQARTIDEFIEEIRKIYRITDRTSADSDDKLTYDLYNDALTSLAKFDIEDIRHALSLKIKNPKPPVQWSKLIRLLGYTGVVDRNNSGIIHPSEPTQAVFFSIANLRLIETVRNYEVEDKFRRWDRKPETMISDIKRGKASTEEIIDFYLEHPKSIGLMDWKYLPEEIKEWFSDSVCMIVPKQMYVVGISRVLRWLRHVEWTNEIIECMVDNHYHMSFKKEDFNQSVISEIIKGAPYTLKSNHYGRAEYDTVFIERFATLLTEKQLLSVVSIMMNKHRVGSAIMAMSDQIEQSVKTLTYILNEDPIFFLLMPWSYTPQVEQAILDFIARSETKTIIGLWEQLLLHHGNIAEPMLKKMPKNKLADLYAMLDESTLSHTVYAPYFENLLNPSTFNR